MTEALTRVEPIQVLRTVESGVWMCVIVCPNCGKEHVHGGGDEDAPNFRGSRVPHCLDGPEYDIQYNESDLSETVDREPDARREAGLWGALTEFWSWNAA